MAAADFIAVKLVWESAAYTRGISTCKNLTAPPFDFGNCMEG